MGKETGLIIYTVCLSILIILVKTRILPDEYVSMQRSWVQFLLKPTKICLNYMNIYARCLNCCCSK